jgi:hypothetical protein
MIGLVRTAPLQLPPRVALAASAFLFSYLLAVPSSPNRILLCFLSMPSPFFSTHIGPSSQSLVSLQLVLPAHRQGIDPLTSISPFQNSRPDR